VQATHGVRRLRMLSLAMALTIGVTACSASTDQAQPATNAPSSTLRGTTTELATTTSTAASPSTVSTTTPTPTTTTTTTTATTTAAPAATTTEPAEIPERSIAVPAAAAPSIDGIIKSGEWDSAAAVTMSNGDTAYWQHSDETLYVALDGDDIGAVNLVLATGEELWILHSSAALGSSLFVPGDETWEQVHGYSWCCRSAYDDTARLGLLEDEGWQANIGFTGDIGVVEYQVAIPWGFARAAIVYHAEDRDSAYWPDDLGSADAEHITSNMWMDPELDPGSWMMLIPEQESGSD